ncbi:IPT/TIG domain-containing protein [Sphingobacterium sp. UBA6320]|uniref:IPT/TIG domain-containing protein n=1 Tax=Sphingobacterium sp. UBA6320 TaxID=1947510 RepID=UPI0032E46A79
MKITVLAPTFDSFSPEKGTAGEIITMKGKAIKYADQIFIGDIPIIPISYSDDEIMFQIPLSISKGKVRLSIVNNGRLISSTNYFEIH